ncbi:TetR/AcrR family transcriptional regulator [Brachybacterium endophyticum]|uniref:TetR/AcrR family transcriptional regulator n=1 Tax=Brachybacterium endophyticum TaxID=2182385 RepID=A0A2U2RKJ4_9MICO|nr:TetR/AcrR family transcriptional regulator [Brachybacterium endophyticum]PWH06399.1 TetR/AcrR family transcriptional regulator [Brachybacterium endophyticum]
MGRTATFATADAVRSARSLFWAEGYENTSMSAIQQATGLNASSIYHAFGSKRGLFEAAIANYLEEVVRPGLAPLLATDPSPHALADYLGRAADLLGEPGGSESLPDGCLLVNTACAGIAREESVREVITSYRAELVRAFGAGVAARFPEAPAAERERITETGVSALLAALVMSRVDPSAARSALDAAREPLRTSTS